MNSGSQGPPAVHRSPSANARVATAAAAVKRGRSSCRAASSSPSLLQRLAFGGSTLRVEFVRAGRPLCDRESGDVTATPNCPVLRAVCLRKRLSGRWLRAADQPAHSREARAQASRAWCGASDVSPRSGVVCPANRRAPWLLGGSLAPSCHPHAQATLPSSPCSRRLDPFRVCRRTSAWCKILYFSTRRPWA